MSSKLQCRGVCGKEWHPTQFPEGATNQVCFKCRKKLREQIDYLVDHHGSLDAVTRPTYCEARSLEAYRKGLQYPRSDTLPFIEDAYTAAKKVEIARRSRESYHRRRRASREALSSAISEADLVLP